MFLLPGSILSKYFELKEVDWWPSSDCVKYFSPSSFKTKFSNTRVIVDGTECPVVVNHCFTSLFDTNGLLSSSSKSLLYVTFRHKWSFKWHCNTIETFSQLMKWMMYRWWCEDGGDRAWWVIESVFIRSPEKGFWACLGDLPPDVLRRPETWASLCNLMLKNCGNSRSSAILGSETPRSNNRKDNSLWVTPFIPRERPDVKHAIAG